MQKHKNTDNKKCHIDECKLEMKSLMTATYNISNSMFPSLYHYQSLAAVPFLATIFSIRFIWPISLDTDLMVPLPAPSFFTCYPSYLARTLVIWIIFVNLN